MSLFDTKGNRLYLTPAERESFHHSTLSVSRDKRMFALMLYHTGCRISEALSVKVKDIDFATGMITLITLKQRKKNPDGTKKTIYRQVPVSPEFMSALDNAYDLRIRQRRSKPRNEYLWGWSRQYGHSVIVEIMKAAKLQGAYAVPKGLRHAYAIASIDKKVPLNMLAKWMGHANLETTAIYANAVGQEEREIAARLWE